MAQGRCTRALVGRREGGVGERPRRMGKIAERHFTVLGTGVVDFTSVVAELRKTGYDGWLVAEQDASPAPRETSTISLDHLRRALSGVGRP